MLSVIVPTRGRPENAVRLANAVFETTGRADTHLLFVVDYDDPKKKDYEDLLPIQAELMTVPEDGPKRMGPVLNYAVRKKAPFYDHIAFMGDDHLPRTQRWDCLLINALGDRPGVAYGNDLNQGEKLPTAVLMSAGIPAALGYMSPPGCEHLYLDNFWLFLGEILGNIKYKREVIIEHMHPTVGKGEWDGSYAMTNSGPQYEHDRRAYETFMKTQWPEDWERLKAGLHL